MHPSRLLTGARRLLRSAPPILPSARAFRACRTAAACTLLASAAAGTAACSSRDAAAARRDVYGDGAMTAAPNAPAPTVRNTTDAGAAHAVPGSRARRTADAVSRTIAATARDTLLASADVYAGWRSFNINCQSCHGLNAVASDAAPDLRNSVRQGGTLTRAQFHEVVKKGRMSKGMPAWGALIEEKEIDQIYAYLVARSTGALGAGRPAVADE